MVKDVPDINPDQLYSATEVGLFIGKHSRTVRRYVKEGKFPNSQRLGQQGQHYIPGSDILAYMKNENS